MHGTDNEGSEPITLPWLVVRQDDNGNRYRVGRYATRAEAQKISDALDARGHRQLYWVERIRQGGATPGTDSRDSRQDIMQGPSSGIRHELGKIPPPPPDTADAVRHEPASDMADRADRRLRRARPLIEALSRLLPADARERWSEEWMAEWIDLGKQPLRTRVAWLLRVTLRSGPFAWSLRVAARRQRVQ
jgi:hypothetical protein